MAALYGVLVVSLSVLLAVAGLELVQYLVPWTVRKGHNDVAGFIYSVLGVVYAVLLAFVTIAVWEDFEAAINTVEREANELVGIFWLADQLPEPEGQQIQDLAHSYARIVIEEEWSLMEQGQGSPRAWALVDEMRSSIHDFEPSTDAELVLYDKELEGLHNLLDERGLRLLEAREGIPRILWVVLVVGGIIVVGFTYLFGLENTQSHRLMIAALAGVIALVLFTIYSLESPFVGITRVSPDAFELALERFEQNPGGGFGFDPLLRFFRESGEAEPDDLGSISSTVQLAA